MVLPGLCRPGRWTPNPGRCAGPWTWTLVLLPGRRPWALRWDPVRSGIGFGLTFTIDLLTGPG